MVQSQKKKNKTNKETRLFDLEIGAGPSVPAASGPFDESLATDPDCPAKSPSRKNKENNQWPKRIKKLFESHEKQAVNPQQGYWDPYTKYDTNERVQRFFNGFEMPMGQDKLVYRERFASWAIGEALKDYDSGQFQLTGEVMHNESVTYKADKDRKSLPKEVVDAIRADGQQDIDAEDSNPVIKDDGELELTQSIGGAAQALISASPNSLGPPILPCATYLQMERVGTYGRNKLSTWNSPLLPEVRIIIEESQVKEEHVSNHRGRKTCKAGKPLPKPMKKASRGFLDNQITGIVWILSRFFGNLPKLKDHESHLEAQNRAKLRGPKYGGAILADSMGLSKTLTAIATMEIMASHGLNVDVDPYNGIEIYCPILILCPNVIVTVQWVEEILQSTSPDSIQHIIASGGNSNHFPVDARVRYLTSEQWKEWPLAYNFIWDMGDRRAARTIIVLPIDTWSFRTCSVVEEDDEKTWHSSFTDGGRYFSLVCVDEAHKVKNASTRNFRSVALLERQFTLLLTATPCLNTLTDLLGLARLMWEAAERYLRETPGAWEQIDGIVTLEELNILDGLESCHDLQLAACRPSLLTRLLCKDRKGNGQDIEDTRRYLRYFESVAMLKRGPGTYIFEDWEKTRPVSLEGIFPAVDNWTVDIELDQKLAQQYQFAHVNLLIDYFKILKSWNKPKDPSSSGANDTTRSWVSIHRQWQIASSSMDVFRLDRLFGNHGYGTKAVHITQLRKVGVTFIKLAKFLRGKGESRPNTALGYLKIAIRGSPILRFILQDLRENILNRERLQKVKKLLITEATPILAYYYEMVLQFIGINCRVFHADLLQDQRKELVASFNSDEPSSVQVLIQMYTVAFAGSNLHKNCSRVIIASQAHSLAVQWQAIHRVIRVGQTQDVKVFRPKVKNSYHAFRESRQIEKILPELGPRAQGGMNQILVQLLNLFQNEVEDAWNSDEGQRLVAERNLLCQVTSQPATPVAADVSTGTQSELDSDTIKDEKDIYPLNMTTGKDEEIDVIKKEDVDESNLDSHAAKKRKLDKGKGVALSSSKIKDEEEVGDNPEELENYVSIPDTASVYSVCNTLTSESTVSGNQQRSRVKKDPTQAPGGLGWFEDEAVDANDDDACETFLALKTRKSYYAEFKRLPKTKSHFDHRKNQLRRLLSFHTIDEDGYAPKKWTTEDLENPPVLERALELMLRVRLGAAHIEMLPFPQINFSAVTPSRIETLRDLIAKVTATDQDIDEAQTATEAKKAKEGLLDSVPSIIKDCQSLTEIDQKFRDEVNYGTMSSEKRKEKKKTSNIAKGTLKYEDRVSFANALSNNSDSPEECRELFNLHVLTKRDADDEHAEGEDSEDQANDYGMESLSDDDDEEDGDDDDEDDDNSDNSDFEMADAPGDEDTTKQNGHTHLLGKGYTKRKFIRSKSTHESVVKVEREGKVKVEDLPKQSSEVSWASSSKLPKDNSLIDYRKYVARRHLSYLNKHDRKNTPIKSERQSPPRDSPPVFIKKEPHVKRMAQIASNSNDEDSELIVISERTTGRTPFAPEFRNNKPAGNERECAIVIEDSDDDITFIEVRSSGNRSGATQLG